MEPEAVNLPKTLTLEKVQDVQHWTETLFSFRTTRPSAFRFRSGEFIMLGLLKNGKPLLRAYSVASPHWDDGLNFYSIKVQDGPLTSLLQHIKPTDEILIGKKPTGTLVIDNLIPAKRLFLLSTGTGIAPFASLIRDPDTYDKFDRIILTHTCRNAKELRYGEHLLDTLDQDPLVGEFARDRIKYFASCTREDYVNSGRITTLMESKELFEKLSIEDLNSETDAIMICGSMGMIDDVRKIIENVGFVEGSNATPASYVIEKAFAE
ncbi:MAG: ferredoxin--NADP(+) reductase [Rhodospirillaceae bacterium]|nr:ferredoxin--NADP(+) reductase [Rhodospirillaceae bacterium]